MPWKYLLLSNLEQTPSHFFYLKISQVSGLSSFSSFFLKKFEATTHINQPVTLSLSLSQRCIMSLLFSLMLVFQSHQQGFKELS